MSVLQDGSVEWRYLFDTFRAAWVAQSKNKNAWATSFYYGGGNWVVATDDLLITSICLVK